MWFEVFWLSGDLVAADARRLKHLCVWTLGDWVGGGSGGMLDRSLAESPLSLSSSSLSPLVALALVFYIPKPGQEVA